jgi:acyl-CoA reductase-like NAD-dependent aldehyde dehydrogenase
MSVIEKMKGLSGKVFIDGEFRASTGTDGSSIIDPATENQIGEYAESPSGEIDQAVASAKAAQKIWWAKSGLERADIMHEVANHMHSLKPQLAESMTREMGKPYKEAADEVDWSVSAIRYYAEVGRHDQGRIMGNAVAGHLNYTLKTPLGVVATLQTFNYPLTLLAWQSGAALATGNAIVVKPSQYTTLTTLIFAEAYKFLPEGLFQVVSGAGPAGKQLVEHPDVNMIAFTGSVPVGKSIAERCGGLMKRCLVEMSGNDPFIIMPSAPLDIAARGATFSAYMNCGQICVSAERFYVHEDIHDAFVEKLVENARKIRIGNGLDKVDMGPMVASHERDRFENTIKKAKEQGAKLELGGGRPAEFNRGWFVEPTILTGCEQDMDIFNEESFGPVAPICKVKSFDEAMDHANNSNFGLGACLYSTDLKESIRAAEELETGMVWVNAPLLDNDAGPFGGTKNSGMGRQLGSEGLENFRNTKTVMIDPNCEAQDFWWFPYADGEMGPGS